MITRKFIFSPDHSHLLDKDLYENVEFKNNQAILTLKQNVKIGYADSFQHAIDYIHKMAELFVIDTVVEINLFNGLCLLMGRGNNTYETIMDLTCHYFNYSLLDTNKVTIEMKGFLNPSSRIKGYFVGEFKNSIKKDGSNCEIEVFSSVKGDVLEDNVIKNSNMMTSFVISKNGNNISYQLRYLSIKQDTGELYSQCLIETNSVKELSDVDSRYKKLIETGLHILNKKMT